MRGSFWYKCTTPCFWKHGLKRGAVFNEGGCSSGVPLYTRQPCTLSVIWVEIQICKMLSACQWRFCERTYIQQWLNSRRWFFINQHLISLKILFIWCYTCLKSSWQPFQCWQMWEDAYFRPFIVTKWKCSYLGAIFVVGTSPNSRDVFCIKFGISAMARDLKLLKCKQLRKKTSTRHGHKSTTDII